MMEILMINGSPKGKNSVPPQASRYLEILHPAHRFPYVHAATRLPSLRRDFSPAARTLKKTARNLERGCAHV